MKKVLKVVAKIFLACAILGGLGYGGYRIYQSRQTVTASAAVSYQQVQVTTGNLEKTVTGTGSLSISETKSVALDFAITADEVYVKSGEQVHTGDKLIKVNDDALRATIATLESELTTIDDSIAQLARQYSDDSNLNTSVAGRVKKIFGAVGDSVQDVVDKYDALLVLSLDGRMNVSIPTGDLAIGDSVVVVDGTSKYDGVVQSVDHDTAVITFSDAKTLEGTSVNVVANSVIIGTGTAQINMPFYFTSTAKGRISKVYYDVNDKPSRGSALFYLTQMPATAEYETLLSQREVALNKLKSAKEVLSSGAVLAPIDGIVDTVITASTTEQAAGTALISLYVGDAKQMIVSVDELDIINVEVGQDVSIAMDAVTDKTYTAVVSYISQLGTSSSGVTTYNVTLDITGDEQLKIGMNGTATINVGEVSNVILVPISALNTSKDGQYVWVYTTSIDPNASEEPGIKTFVTTGMASENYAEVLSGLNVGDYVLVTRTASTSSQSQNQMMGGMEMGGGMPNMEGGMPAQMPTGGGNGTRTFTGGSGQGSFSQRQGN